MQPSSHARVCPTRIDAAPALFAHRLSVAQCSERQRGRYHKCYTCAYAHAQVAAHGLPEARLDKRPRASATPATSELAPLPPVPTARAV